MPLGKIQETECSGTNACPSARGEALQGEFVDLVPALARLRAPGRSS
ncbi:hypothetical protein B0G84_1474 [Paraburkholderia sp. BL8N3]|nr:hypothetical protein B0G84_1474 [Paraburkholderia sp. BL8N3]